MLLRHFKFRYSIHFISSIIICLKWFYLLQKEIEVLILSSHCLTVIWSDTYWSSLVMKLCTFISLFSLLFCILRIFPLTFRLLDELNSLWNSSTKSLSEIMGVNHEGEWFLDDIWWVLVINFVRMHNLIL